MIPFIVTVLIAAVPFGALWMWRSRHYDDVNRLIRESLDAEQAKRRASLVERFGEDSAARVLAHEVWMGATTAMLLESLGQPAGATEQTTARRERETYKYHPTSHGGHVLKVTLDDGIVTGWDGDRAEATARANVAEAVRDYRAPKSSRWTLGAAIGASIGVALMVTMYRACDPRSNLPTTYHDDATPAPTPVEKRPVKTLEQIKAEAEAERLDHWPDEPGQAGYVWLRDGTSGEALLTPTEEVMDAWGKAWADNDLAAKLAITRVSCPVKVGTKVEYVEASIGGIRVRAVNGQRPGCEGWTMKSFVHRGPMPPAPRASASASAKH